MANRLLEKYVQVVRMDGINTNKNVTIGVNGVLADLSVSGDLTVGGSINFAATTFDDPVNFQDTVTFESGAVTTFEDDVTFDNGANLTFEPTAGNLTVNSTAYLNQGVAIRGVGIDASPVITSGASQGLGGEYSVYNVTVDVNTNITIASDPNKAGTTVTVVLTALAGGETVDFVGASMLSQGTLTLGAGAGDVSSVTFANSGTVWVEVSRTGTLS